MTKDELSFLNPLNIKKNNQYEIICKLHVLKVSNRFNPIYLSS